MVQLALKTCVKANPIFKPKNVQPCFINGRTLVPLKFISEALGTGTLANWDGATRNA